MAAKSNGTKSSGNTEKAGNDDSGSEGIAPCKPGPAKPETLAAVRRKINETIGLVTVTMIGSPRYRNLTIADLSHLLLDPLLRNRIAIAHAADPKADDGGVAGIAIWASVSGEADARIREQIKTGVFPLRLKADDWNSGEIHWLLDVIAPTRKLAAAVLANFRQVVKGTELRIHPGVAGIVGEETLKKLGANSIRPEGEAGK